eukprot:11206321-Lingulodinium_polyedra.AAC.1
MACESGRVSKTVHDDAVESTVSRHNGSQIARLAYSMQHQNWCLHGVREACGSRAAVPAYGRFDRIIAR